MPRLPDPLDDGDPIAGCVLPTVVLLAITLLAVAWLIVEALK